MNTGSNPNAWQPCPGEDCQGLIDPENIAVGDWYDATTDGWTRTRRNHYIYCPTCGGAWAMIENSGGVERMTAMTCKTHIGIVRSMIRKLHARQRTSIRRRVVERYKAGEPQPVFGPVAVA